MSERKACEVCATWVCGACGWERVRADRNKVQRCHDCKGSSGYFYPIHHNGLGPHGLVQLAIPFEEDGSWN